MLNYTTKKKNKLNAYKAVRESISLNKNVSSTIDLQKKLVNEENLMLQLAEINLVNHLQNQNICKKEKMVFKWWEN